MAETDDNMRRVVNFDDDETMVQLLGPRDTYLKQVRDALHVKMVVRGRRVTVEGEPDSVSASVSAIEKMREHIEQGRGLNDRMVDKLVREARTDERADFRREKADLLLESVLTGRTTQPRTPGQARYIRAILENDIVFCTGPAGSGKTYLAVAVALDHLRRGELRRLVLCRPAVEAGEHLGYLPGDMRAKVNPYLRPLYDALHDLVDPATVRRYVDNDLIEILPLAFVRGRTLDHAFIILDEAQNCTVAQMKTFLTRLGATAKLVVTGDITQIDLPPDKRSGLVDVQSRLHRIPGIGHIHLETVDIVRHRLVRDIVHAYQEEPPAETERPTGTAGETEEEG